MSSKRPYLIVVLFIAASLIAKGQIISTFAGDGTYGYSGNGGPATSAHFAWPLGTTTDNTGNVYIADHDNNVVRVVNSAGIISNFAGNHSLGYTGDGGPAALARLYHPGRLTSDNAGNIYIADQNSEVIRKVDAITGIISTITGNLGPGYFGDGGPLAGARFNGIAGISFDNTGNLYIADFSNHVIRKVNTAGIITTIAGNGTPGFSGDGGPATSAQLNDPYGVIFDNAGNIYIPDSRNHRIRKINPAGIISTYAGTATPGYSGDGGPSTNAQLHFPWSLAIDNGQNIYIAEPWNYVVRRISPAGIITTYAGNGTPGYSGDGGPATAAQLVDIGDISLDNNDNLYIVNRTPYEVIRKVSNCLLSAINQQPGNVTLCGGGTASFSIDASNFSGLHWQVNTGSGWNDLTDNVNYAGTNSNNLIVSGVTPAMNNYQYRCTVANACATIFSAPATLVITTALLPAINVTASATTICSGTNVTFTAIPANEGSSPVYQWTNNGINVGINSNSYSANNLNNGDIISCQLTSSNTCVTSATVTGNAIIMTVTSPVTPSINISPSTNNICSGTPVIFTASIVNGGPNPQYTWFKNSVNLQLNSPTYTDNTFNDGDIIVGVVLSSLSCTNVNPAISAPVTMNVTTSVTPAISITTSANPVCKEASVTFTAATANGGLSPSYQWKKNNIVVGLNSSTYTDNTINNGDIVTCSLTSNSNCLLTPAAVSNQIIITVLNNPVVTLDHTSTLCRGSNRQLDAGNFAGYLWNDGSTGRTLTINNTGTYYVTVTDNNSCHGSDTTKITTILPVPSGFAPPDTAICSYGTLLLIAQNGYTNYLWNIGSIGFSVTISKPGLYWLEVTDNNHCKGKDTILVSPKECMTGFFIPDAFTPNGDGKNETFGPLLFGNVLEYSFAIYNRWGELVFQTHDRLKQWDGSYGGKKQDSNVYVWTCSYQLEGEKRSFKNGKVVIIR